MYESKVLTVLLNFSSTLYWLALNQPADRLSLPQEHCEAIKRLEDMGIVCRRNQRQLTLQKQRLHKLLRRELTQHPRLKERCIAEFSHSFNSTEL